MKNIKYLTLGLLLAVSANCGNDEFTNNDSGENIVEEVTNTGVIPSWTLEDIQPASDRFGDVYGLDHFEGEVLVAVLVQGF